MLISINSNKNNLENIVYNGKYETYFTYTEQGTDYFIYSALIRVRLITVNKRLSNTPIISIIVNIHVHILYMHTEIYHFIKMTQ